MNEVPYGGVNTKPLWSGFHQSALAFPDRSALEVNGQVLTYAQLHNKAASLAATLTRHSRSETPPLTAVFSKRSVTAFAAVLGALFHGHGYVPLDRTFPPARTRFMLQHSRCRSLIADDQSEAQLEEILAAARDQMLLIFPDRDNVKDLATRWAQHIVLGGSDLESPDSWAPPASSISSIAYLLFTSGSTGTPKAVMVSHDNVRHYVDWAVSRYQVTEEDRVSQIVDLTFDLSAHDMFVAWECGACVFCPTQKERFKPSGFINDSRITMWVHRPAWTTSR
jgi:non-ribosomal peptide synthetase component F